MCDSIDLTNATPPSTFGLAFGADNIVEVDMPPGTVLVISAPEGMQLWLSDVVLQQFFPTPVDGGSQWLVRIGTGPTTRVTVPRQCASFGLNRGFAGTVSWWLESIDDQ